MTRQAVYYLVEARDALRSNVMAGQEFRFAVRVGGELRPESRSIDQLISAAADKGFEISYCSGYEGGPEGRIQREIARRVLNQLRRHFLIHHDYEVTVDFKARLILYA